MFSYTLEIAPLYPRFLFRISPLHRLALTSQDIAVETTTAALSFVGTATHIHVG